jgi:hypothetical protein
VTAAAADKYTCMPYVAGGDPRLSLVGIVERSFNE